MSRHQNRGQNHSIKVADKSFEIVEMTVTNKNDIYE